MARIKTSTQNNKLLAHYLVSALLITGLSFFSPCIYAQQLLISSFAPASGPVGTTVIISGSGFQSIADSNIVYFGATRAAVTAATSSTLSVTVPPGATFQPISVTTGKLTAYASEPFTVTFSASPVLSSGSFISQTNLTTGLVPFSVVVGDFDVDGKADLATANFHNATISIFRNNSSDTLSFTSKRDYQTASSPIMLVASDFNGDGKLDIAVANETGGNVSVFTNMSTPGNISFTTAGNFVVGSGPITIIAEDFDKDGKPDIATSNSRSASVSILKNVTTGNNILFQAKADFATGPEPYSISSADFNQDGKPDMVVANHLNSTVSVLKNTSADTFSFSRQDYPSAGYPFFTAVADFDGDKKPDFAVVDYRVEGGSLEVSRNNSSGSIIAFDGKISFPSMQPVFVMASDINGDGKPDLAVVNYNARTLSIYINTSAIGKLSFANPVAIPLNGGECYSAAFGDFNQDNVPELAAVSGFTNTLSLYKYIKHAPGIASFQPVHATTGETVTIRGIGFAGASAVHFGVTPAASFTVMSDSVIAAVVGAGASGNVSVSTLNGVVTLNGFTFDLYTSIVNIDQLYYIRSAPNPVKDLMNITYKLPAAVLLQVEVYDLQGKRMEYFTKVQSNSKLNLSRLPAQIYFIRILDQQGKQLHTGKFIKE